MGSEMCIRDSAYSVIESAGAVTLMVRVLGGTISEGESIVVRLTTMDDSAQGMNHC